MPQIKTTRPLLLAAAGLGVFVSVAVCALFWMRMEDDPYIYMRFARNLIQRGEVAFNPGHPLVGFTSLLHFLAVTALGLLTDRLPEAVFSLGVLLHGLSALALGWFVIRMEAQAGVPHLLPLALVVWFGFDVIQLSSLGMESGWMALLIFISLGLYFTGREGAALALAGLLVWVRPDAALLPPFLLLDYVVRRRRLPWGALAVMALCCAAWLAFNFAATGHALPSTLAAKMAQGAARLDRGFGEKLFLKGFPRHEKQYGFYLILGGLMLRFLVALGRERPWRRFALLPAWALAYAVAYSLLNVPYYYLWYYTPLIAALCVMAALGATLLTRDGARRPALRLLAGAALWIYPFFMLAGALRDPSLASRARQTAGYRATAEYIRRHVPAGEAVATVEIGVLGYGMPNPVVDLAAIVTPEAAAHLKQRDFDWPFARFAPPYVVVHGVANVSEAPVVSGAFRERYEPIFAAPAANPAETIRLLRRKP